MALSFWFVFRIPIAKSRVELSEGLVSEFENRPVSASLRNDRQQIPHSPTLQSAPSCKILAMRSFADFFCPKEDLQLGWHAPQGRRRLQIFFGPFSGAKCPENDS